MPQAFEQAVTFIYARDVERSWRFYEEAVGLEAVLDQGSVRIYRVGASDAFLGVCRARALPDQPPPDRAPRGVVYTFVSRDVDGWHERLKAKGAAIETAPAHNAQYNIYNFFFRDPDGYLMEVQRFLAPEWPKPKA